MNPDQRINMSLDDLIKARNQEQKKKKPAAGAKRPNSAGGNKKPAIRAGGAANAARPNSANKKTRAPRQNNNNNNHGNSMDVDVRMNKSVGAGRAKRNAQVNARRGLQATNVASKQDIRKEVGKQMQKKRPASAKSNNASPAAPSMKISFRPGELAKTTEKVVSQQIKAVLSRQASPRANNNNNNNKSNNPTGRTGPKARGKNVLRVVH